MRWLPVPALVLAACASAGNPADEPPIDGPSGGGEPLPIDGPSADAAPQPANLSQNTSTTPNSTRLGCADLAGLTNENSYYRVFSLADHGITGSYEVQSVTFAVNFADGGGSSQPAQVKIGRYTGTPGGLTLSLADIVPIKSVSISIPDGSTSITTPIKGVVPPGGHLIVELAIPDGGANGNEFFVGSNGAGESKPGYLRAPSCGDAVPKSMNAIAADNGIGKVDLIMTVNGVRY